MKQPETCELMVTIRCLVYNHAPYIRQCLDGFVMQKTNFRFEAIVHDDASTDGSADIIREYAAKYPDIIKPIFQTENQYSKHDGSIRRILNAHTHGKYVAMCEGDDYWTDPLKLQKQVDFLESHPDYTMCFANAIEHFENKKQEDRLFSIIKNQDYTGIDFFTKWIVPTASVLFKREILSTPLYHKYTNNKNIIFGDTPLFLTCAHYGKVKGFSDVFSVYRRHGGGMTHTICSNLESFKKYDFHVLEIYKIFGPVYKKLSIKFFLNNHCQIFWDSLLSRQMKTRYDFLQESLSVSVIGTVKALLKIFKSKLIRKIRRKK